MQFLPIITAFGGIEELIIDMPKPTNTEELVNGIEHLLIGVNKDSLIEIDNDHEEDDNYIVFVDGKEFLRLERKK